jgi:hypothetical protein
MSRYHLLAGRGTWPRLRHLWGNAVCLTRHPHTWKFDGLCANGKRWRQHHRQEPGGCGPRPLLLVNGDTCQYHRTSERSNLLPGSWPKPNKPVIRGNKHS